VQFRVARVRERRSGRHSADDVDPVLIRDRHRRASFSGAGASVMIVVVDGGKEFYQMRISPSSIVVFGTTKLVSSGDNGGNQQ